MAWAKPHHLLLALAAFAVSDAAWAQVGSEESFNRIYRSAYYLGRGDTGIAIADDEEAIFYNPAGIAQGKGIYKKTVLAAPFVEFSKSTRDVVRQLGAENADAVDTVQQNVGKPNHIGAQTFTGLILRRAALGAFATSNVDLLAYKSADEGGLEVVDASADQTVGVTFSLAESFWSDKLLLGVTAKYLARGRGAVSASAAEADEVQEKLEDRSSLLGTGEGGGADLGAMYKIPGRIPVSFGLTISDVGDTVITPQEPTTMDLDVKQTINAGFAVEPGTKTSRLRLLFDYRDIAGAVTTNERKKVHAGAELAVRDVIGITGGINQGYATGGFYIDLYVLRLDLGMYTQEVGERVGTRPDTRYFVRLKAGF
jgi:hypothetical protein